ncbi:DUF4396 domain-containing protein [Stenotrophobium rhamnosiphilum]|uniref:DUF4396 domain-containing protein n=1 Tax=Stenotrophobium rhamnosiphilum TaxID=2029166 RepID=A0A2T5MCS4_9GAMM|nr:DUF4396 domain-containing protein [Stenotrophobium rhamnosiphilum]PTU30378.1 hypothetical protein CJD38_15675 [Stenotrophobium rhamnosiphilum]
MNTETHKDSAAPCCHSEPQEVQVPQASLNHRPHQGHSQGSSWSAAARVTVHCLTGCAIGEFIGLAIGVSLGLPVHVTITLAVVLSFISGFALTIYPMMRRGVDFSTAFKTIWLGEVISISVMELMMNLIDYHMGGMRAAHIFVAQYWEAFGAALVAGYFAALPVNKWMLSRNMKNCH